MRYGTPPHPPTRSPMLSALDHRIAQTMADEARAVKTALLRAQAGAHAVAGAGREGAAALERQETASRAD